MTKITYTITAHDDGYRVRDWFSRGQATLEAAEDAPDFASADAILAADYLGADVDGVNVVWKSAE